MLQALIKSITKKEWCFFIIITVFIIITTTIPYIYGWYKTPPDSTYSGLHSLTPGDIHVYFSYIEQARQGHLVQLDLYSGEPQGRVMFNGFWSFTGILAKAFHLSNIVVFQLVRILFIPLLLFILYLLTVYYFPNPRWRLVGFIFLVFASGLGAAFSFVLENNVYKKGWYNWPLDLWAAESNTLLTMLQSGHLVLSTGLIIATLFLFFISLEHKKIKYSIISGFLALILFQFHPFHVPTIFAVIGIYILYLFIKNKKIGFNILKHAFIFFAISSPSLAYYFWLSRSDFFTQMRTYQNICLTPSWWVTIISYGFILAFTVYGSYQLFKNKKLENKYIFLVVWIVAQSILVYSPLPWQRRMLQGLQIPLGILAVWGLYYFFYFLKRKISPQNFNFFVNNKYLAVILFIIFFCPSQIFNWVREFSIFTDKRYIEQLYPKNDKLIAFHWLKDNATLDNVILSDIINGNLIPGITGRKVFAGHGVETLFFGSKSEQVLWFYKINNLDDKKKKFLKENDINFIFFSESEAEVGDFEPGQKNYLREVYRSGQVYIYRVMLE
ncbi:hypothetical protein GYA54_04045 [Candidatus Kuenenbacteria bacterium]|nr:hypothetical protein [Candidatus Kuenenbacteria bacterium]